MRHLGGSPLQMRSMGVALRSLGMSRFASRSVSSTDFIFETGRSIVMSPVVSLLGVHRQVVQFPLGFGRRR